MSLNAFQPSGGPFATVLVALTSSPSSPMQISTGGSPGVRLYNSSTAPAYVSLGTTQGSSASLQAQLPTTAVPGSMALLPTSVETFNVGPNVWLSAMTSAGAGQLMGTPGYGQ